MKAVKLVLTIDVEELPCCPSQIREIHVQGALKNENVVYTFWNGEFYKRELAGLEYDEAKGCCRTQFPVFYDEDIMTGHGFEKIELPEDLNDLKGVFEALLA